MSQELTPAEIETLAECAEDGTEDLLADDIATDDSDGQTFYGSDYPTARSTEAKNRAFMATSFRKYERSRTGNRSTNGDGNRHQRRRSPVYLSDSYGKN